MNQSRPSGGVHPTALVRAVDRGISLVHHDFIFVWSPYVFGPEGRLPSRGHPSGGHEHIVPSVLFVHLGAFGGRRHLGSVEDHLRFPQKPPAVPIHLHQSQPVLDAAAASGKGEDHVGPPVLIPEGAGVDPSFGFTEEISLKSSPWISPPGHINSLVRQGDKDKKLPLMVPDRRGPGSGTVGRPLVFLKRKGCYAIINQFPVNQVPGVQQRHSGEIGKGRRYHVESPPPTRITSGSE